MARTQGVFFLVAIVLCNLLLPPNTSYAKDKISIASFNIQIFGKSKAKKHDVMTILVDIISKYELVAIQEIRDKSGTAIEKLKTELLLVNENYDYVISSRQGRTSSKEQYAFFYRTDLFDVPIEKYIYDDQNDDFEREPFIVKFNTKENDFDFVLINIHVDPDDANKEINQLDNVVIFAKMKFPGEKDFMIMGDLNADCSYFDEDNKSNKLRSSNYVWLINNDADTNLSKKSCTYDRIIVTQDLMKDYAGKCGVLLFDEEYGLNPKEAKKVSDHYPVYCKFHTTLDDD
jgi:deoxyribonuclease-1-like protein